MITRKNRAFLLIEVMVTVVIVSCCIIFINHAFTSSFRAASLSGDYLSALLLLENKSFDFELEGTAIESEVSGEEEFMGKTFQWTKTVSALEAEDLGEDYDEQEIPLGRLGLSLKWKRQQAQRSVEILTYTLLEEGEA